VNPYYADDLVTLYLGDCREVLPQLELEASIDLALTDPPYNVGKDYGGHDDAMPPQEYARWTAEWWQAVRAKSRRAIVFPGHGNLGMWLSMEKPAAIGCWYKPGNGAGSLIGFEEWEPWLYWHGGNKGLLGGSSVVRAVTGKQLDAMGHPCPKPVPLMVKLLHKARAREVVDPFVGSGTTLVAAKMLGIRSTGIELNERYCELTARRLDQGVLDFGETA
jgi:DNA modification methylase